MNLDVQLIVTHIIGFVIMVWILGKFAWKPLMGILEDRRQKIKSEFDKIETGKAEVADIKADLEAKLKDIDNLSRQRLTEAVNEGQRIAAEIKEGGRKEAKDIITRAKEELQRDVEKARAALKEDMVSITLAAAEKVISARLDDTENRRLVTDFIDNVEKV
jgi:F-type H+-transporting ATPase subunit b